MLDDVGLAGILVGSIRFFALFLIAPFFAHPTIPPRLRLALALTVAGSMGALVPAPSTASLASLVLGEALLGFALGFTTRLVVAGFAMMGEVVSIQGGLGAASVLDPTSNASTVALASLINLFAILVFVSIGGDHALIRALSLSLEKVPVGTVGFDSEMLSGIASLGFIIFEIAVKLAMPLTVAMLLSNLAVGILGRTIPQLNLMTVQLPALLGVTLILIVVGSESFIAVMSSSIESWIQTVSSILLGGG